jgi:hypothetical protein
MQKSDGRWTWTTWLLTYQPRSPPLPLLRGSSRGFVPAGESNPDVSGQYLKPLQPEETWTDADELWTWLEDTTGVDLRFERSQGIWMDVHEVLDQLESEKRQER